VIFNYDYSQLSIPSAPHSTGGDTHGLFMTVNKNNSFQAAGLNLYPIGQNFTGNYALRFDMFLILGSGSFTTEYALCGINHSGTQTNWFRNSGAGVVGGYNFDGVWAYIEADGAALGDYILNSGPAVTNAGVVDPTTLASQTAVNMARIFHTPPWAPGAGAGGAPSNLQATTTPVWAQVELSQIGKIVTLKIDNAVILSYSNTTPYTAGNVMLGYDDAFDSQGPADAAVVYDNVRVVSLPPGLHIDQIQAIGGNAQIDFSWFENDPANAFKLQLATNVVGPYVDDTNTATAYSVVSPASSYRIVTPRTTATRFYRVRHL
jgi:hypothetical protein